MVSPAPSPCAWAPPPPPPSPTTHTHTHTHTHMVLHVHSDWFNSLTTNGLKRRHQSYMYNLQCHFLGDWFCVSRMGGMGEEGGFIWSMASLVPRPAWIASSISRGEGGSGDLTGGNKDLWNVNNSFTHDIISITFYRKKIVSTRYLFVYECLLLCGSTSLWHYILASFAEEIPDCRDRRILHSDLRSTGCQ